MTMKVGFICLGIMGKAHEQKTHFGKQCGYSLRCPIVILKRLSRRHCRARKRPLRRRRSLSVTSSSRCCLTSACERGWQRARTVSSKARSRGTVLIDMSSIAPPASREISDALKAKGR
ncbi:hypothetical protein KCP78_15875 [Salmonella enterica subsp. enterica]|nr:hypothetical protein KCP78_15875 [Salmonella enterica subsp. enterica]